MTSPFNSFRPTSIDARQEPQTVCCLINALEVDFITVYISHSDTVCVSPVKKNLDHCFLSLQASSSADAVTPKQLRDMSDSVLRMLSTTIPHMDEVGGSWSCVCVQCVRNHVHMFAPYTAYCIYCTLYSETSLIRTSDIQFPHLPR